MNAILIREPLESELAAIDGLLAELVDAIEDADEFDLATARQNCRALFDDPGSHFLVAVAGGTLVGFINFTTRQTILHPAPSGLIDELVVTRTQRGRGIGRQLIAAALETCRQLGSCEVEVSTEASNQAARQFYARCGFEQEAVLLEAHLD